jgi:CheY-like chemotaxis protein
LCKNLIELMGGEISLDDEYDSGIPGSSGTRFVIDLKTPPVECYADSRRLTLEPVVEEGAIQKRTSEMTGATDCSDSGNSLLTDTAATATELPESLSLLLIDDDPIIRKLFARSIKRAAPGWTFREAASGEAGLCLTESESFDLIFVDMYMASVEKQLLGTETVAAMRSRGINCRIAGLSANDKELEFMEAGANAFTIKPFPCGKEELTRELLRVLHIRT